MILCGEVVAKNEKKCKNENVSKLA